MSSGDGKIGYGRALSRASALPSIGPVAVIFGLGIGALLVAFHVMHKG